MRKNNVLEFQGLEARLDPLTELLRKGAQDLIGQAVGIGTGRAFGAVFGLSHE